MKLHEIVTGQLYQRGAFTHFSLDDRLAALAEKHIDTVLNCSPDDDPELHGAVHYIHFPMPDNSTFARHVDVCHALASKMAVRIEEGHVVLTHCHVGANRSGLMNALIVRRLMMVSGGEALEIVRSRRPKSIRNKFFEDYLRELPAP